MKEKKDYKEYKEYEDYDDLAPTVEKLEATAAEPVEPDAQFKASARKRLLNSLPENEPARAARRQPRSGYRVTAVRLVAVFTAFAVVVSGVAAASTDSLPGDTLYPVKRFVEQGRVIAARNDEARAEVYVDLADKRLMETEALVKKRRPRNVEATLQLMSGEYDLAQESIQNLPVEKRERLLARLEKANLRQLKVLESYKRNRNVPRAMVVRTIARIERNREVIREIRQSLINRP